MSAINWHIKDATRQRMREVLSVVGGENNNKGNCRLCHQRAETTGRAGHEGREGKGVEVAGGCNLARGNGGERGERKRHNAPLQIPLYPRGS